MTFEKQNPERKDKKDIWKLVTQWLRKLKKKSLKLKSSKL